MRLVSSECVRELVPRSASPTTRCTYFTTYSSEAHNLSDAVSGVAVPVDTAKTIESSLHVAQNAHVMLWLPRGFLRLRPRSPVQTCGWCTATHTSHLSPYVCGAVDDIVNV